MRLILRWLINAVSLLVVAYFVPGFVVHSFMDALIAALVFGLVNATLGAVLRVLTFPITVLTLGLFLIVLNAIMLKIAAAVVADDVAERILIGEEALREFFIDDADVER